MFYVFSDNFSSIGYQWGSINCGGKLHKIKLSKEYYDLSSPMYVIPIGVDVVLWIQWLKTFDKVSTKYNEVFKILELERVQYELKRFKSLPS